MSGRLLNGSGRPVLSLRCYCCAQPITDRMALVQMGATAEADRVMVFSQKCLARVAREDAAVFVVITAAQADH
jgi:hypothetical protein